MRYALAGALLLLAVPAVSSAQTPHPDCVGSLQRPASRVKASTAQYPTFRPGATVYRVCPDETNLIISNLVIPDGKTIVFDPTIRSVDWVVERLVVPGRGTIDLRPQLTPPAAPGRVPMRPEQADYCTPGKNGSRGLQGRKGLNGTNLAIRDLKTVDNDGTLWIRTDGQDGGPGGPGQNGQKGGGPRRVIGRWCEDRPGGRGGPGGYGGQGGLPAQVSITFRSNPGSTPVRNNQPPGCGLSNRPSAGTGLILISGRPGCRGPDSTDKGRDRILHN